MKFVQDIVRRPIITEQVMDTLADKRYAFEVSKDATKPEIAKAVEEMFGEGIKVAKVRTMNMKRKPKRLGVHFGYRAGFKKAIVTLTEDSKTIEFFDGMY